jgi:hypothetical protein
VNDFLNTYQRKDIDPYEIEGKPTHSERGEGEGEQTNCPPSPFKIREGEREDCEVLWGLR